jgi:hypothetical protein
MERLMRQTGLGALVGAVLVLLTLCLVGSRNEAVAQRPGGLEPATGELITLTALAAENRQQITVIDPRTRVMCVYQIDPASGIVALKSVRSIQFDLMMQEFNGVSPLPREIRAMVDNH